MNNDARAELKGRPDLVAIFEFIPGNSRLLDLGCGDGTLIKLLRKHKKCDGCGIEVSQDKIIEAVAKGVPVLHEDLDEGFKDYPDDSFDYVVLSQTLQAVDRPDNLLKNMIRVGRKAVVSIINMGHIKARYQLAIHGAMPVTHSLPSKWFNTKNIHLSTICDFRKLCDDLGLKIVSEIPLGYRSHFLAKLWPNLFAPTCVFVIEK